MVNYKNTSFYNFLIIIILAELKAKAKAIEQEHKISKQIQQKSKERRKLNFKINTSNLPDTTAGTTDETKIAPYIEVLRKTHEMIGVKLQVTRINEKKQKIMEKKMKNPNFVKNELFKERRKNSLSRKIRLMRNRAIFPLPKSCMNYRIRNGFLKKNSIK